MRWLLVLALMVAFAGSALAAIHTSNTEVLGPKGSGNGASDGREGGETWYDAVVIGGLPYTDTGATCDNVADISTTCGGGGTAQDVVYMYTPAANVTVTVSLCGSSYDTVLEVQQGIGVAIACNDDYCGLQSEIQGLALLGGTTYYIIVDGYGTGCGSYTLSVTEPVVPVLECPTGALLEGEPDCYDEYYDSYNGGCNSVGFPEICPQSGNMATMCGKSGTYSYQGSSYRDTDWFTCYGAGMTATLTCVAEFPLQLIFIYGADCNNLQYTYTTAQPMVPATLSWFMAQGVPFWPWIGSSQFTGVPCGSDWIMDLAGIWCQPTATQPSTWGTIKGLYK